MEKGNVVSIHKKSDKQNMKNQYFCFRFVVKYLRDIFNEMFNYFSTNKLVSTKQASFQPGDFCINQLLSITHEIFTSFW